MKQYQSYFSLLLLLISTSVFSQYTDIINSSRPGESETAYSVGVNVIQFETGLYYLNEKHAPLSYKVGGAGGNFTARYGLLWEPLEVSLQTRFQFDKFKDQRSDIEESVNRANFRNLTLGFKYLVFDPYKKKEEEKPNLYSWKENRKFKWKHLIPAVSAYLGGNMDTKDSPYLPYTAPYLKPVSDGGFSFKLGVNAQNNFANGWVLVTNLFMDRIGSDYSEFQYIFTLTKALNQRVVLFGEIQGINGDYYSDNLTRVGGAYLFNKNFQLDANFTFNAKDSPSVAEFHVGASYRLDFHEDKEEIINYDDEKKETEKEKKKKRKKKGKKKKEIEEESENERKLRESRKRKPGRRRDDFKGFDELLKKKEEERLLEQEEQYEEEEEQEEDNDNKD